MAATYTFAWTVKIIDKLSARKCLFTAFGRSLRCQCFVTIGNNVRIDIKVFLHRRLHFLQSNELYVCLRNFMRKKNSKRLVRELPFIATIMQMISEKWIDD